jgi:hypothetical protein
MNNMDNHKIGNMVKVSSNPTSAYHKMHGDDVLIIGVDEYPNPNIDDMVYTFIHPVFGAGALFGHGLKTDPVFYSYAGEWGKGKSLEKPMLTKFLGQKLDKEIGRNESLHGDIVITYLHSSLGFIAVKDYEMEKGIFVGER